MVEKARVFTESRPGYPDHGFLENVFEQEDGSVLVTFHIKFNYFSCNRDGQCSIVWGGTQGQGMNRE